MDEKKQKIQELAKQLLQLASDECEWYDSAELSQEDLDNIKTLGDRTDYIGTIVKMLWNLTRKVDELEKKTKDSTISPFEPIRPYEPFTPYVPQPSAPTPWTAPWYQQPLVTYCDSEGNKFDIDYSQPFSVTCTYQGAQGAEPTVHTYKK